jgi:AcrR family transcriptional regulator
MHSVADELSAVRVSSRARYRTPTGAEIISSRKAKPSVRRKGVQSSQTRSQLIAAASEIVREKGYLSLTTRELAKRVGLTRYIVHYYFGTMEELIVALIQRDNETMRTQVAQELRSDEPLRAIAAVTQRASKDSLELMALAARNEKVRSEIASQMSEFNALARQALECHLQSRGIRSDVPPSVMVALITGASNIMAVEPALGARRNGEFAAFLEEWLQSFAESGQFPVRRTPQPIKTKEPKRG